VARCCECGDEPSGSCARELIGRSVSQLVDLNVFIPHFFNFPKHII
jgi:hypothetical protein